MKKLFSIFAALLFAGSMMATDATVDLSAGSHDGSAITWTAANGNITIKQLKGTSGTAVNASYISAPRVYKGHILSFECATNYTITAIEITCNGTNYGNSMTAGIAVVDNVVTDNTTAISRTWTTTSGGKHSVSATNANGESNIYIQNVASASNVQLRFTGLKISYIKAATTDPEILAANVDFGTKYFKKGNIQPFDVKVDVVGYNLTNPILATTASDEVTIGGQLPKEGGELTLTITPAAAGAFSASIHLASDLGGGSSAAQEITITGTIAEVQEYEVAAAIAATATDPATIATNDFIGVRGVVKKIDLKGQNFAQYGSANIYVEDATGAEGEFEFYNCYALNADTFKTTTPAYDPSSTSFASFTAVTDGNGNSVELGDTVVAWGKYTKYNSTYELNTGCYLVSVKKPGAVVEPTYYLKNNWDGGGDWSWKEMTKVNDDQYKLENVVFGGTGVNWNTAESDEGASWVALEAFEGDIIKALDTVNLILTPSTGTIYATLVGEYIAPADPTWTVAGDSEAAFGTTWTPANTDNDMVKQSDGTFLWEKEGITLAAGSIAFKVCCDHAWTVAYPSDNYSLAIPEAGIYTISISFDPASHEITATATKTGSAVVIPTIALHGNFTGSWADTELFTLAANEETASLTLALTAGNYEFGMRIGGSGNWTSNGAAFTRTNPSAVVVAGSGNLTLAADVAGDYVFTWTYETNTLSVEFPVIPEYGIFIDDVEHGAIATSVSLAAVGTTVTVTITPDEGYELDELSASGGELEFNVAEDKKSATFVMPGRAITISATFKEVAAATKYCELPTGHLKDANFGDPNGRILLTIQKEEGTNNIRVAIKNNNDNGNTKTGLNYLWVNAEGATGGVVRYGDGTHTEADVEEISVIIPFDAAKETYNFINIHWAYSGWDGEWAIDGLTVQASELCEDYIPTAIENNEIIEKAVKFIENGQLFIQKNGKTYNAQGVMLK